MSLKFSYTLLAPFYDLAVGPVLARARRRSLARLPGNAGTVLVNGAGTGLDLPLLPRRNRYVALDITRAMLARAARRGEGLDVALIQADSLALPLRDACVDCAVLHLILAVVPDPVRALTETARVVKAGGRVLILDKFLSPRARAPLRRILSPLAARIATRTDVVFEHVLAQVPGLVVESDEAALARGWFRTIVLRKEPPA